MNGSLNRKRMKTAPEKNASITIKNLEKILQENQEFSIRHLSQLTNGLISKQDGFGQKKKLKI